MKRLSAPVPYEHVEQTHLFQWAAIPVVRQQYPELEMMFAIPNGGARTGIAGALMKAEGVKKGVPDILLPVKRGGHSGLFVEMKRRKHGVVSEDQNWWIANLEENGFMAVVVKGFDEARTMIEWYLGLEKTT
ncbi:MAG: VRR-NUC domain-containing protein [Magnetococcales bacterium]|nr:VRR-NUC domain-containing protein [Magnetococcales bacterium]